MLDTTHINHAPLLTSDKNPATFVRRQNGIELCFPAKLTTSKQEPAQKTEYQRHEFLMRLRHRH